MNRRLIHFIKVICALCCFIFTLSCTKLFPEKPSKGNYVFTFRSDTPNFVEEDFIYEIVSVKKDYFLYQLRLNEPDTIFKNGNNINGIILKDRFRTYSINGEIVDSDFMEGTYILTLTKRGISTSTGTFTIKKQD